jgi:hypothetical protein
VKVYFTALKEIHALQIGTFENKVLKIICGSEEYGGHRDYDGRSNVAEKWLKLLLLIREIPSSHLGPETGYTDRVLSWFSSVPLGYFRETTIKLGHDRFLVHAFYFIIHLSSFLSTVTEKALLNKFKVNK